MKIITRTVWILSLVSLFTDVASEMLYPVTPIYLRSINFSVLFIGVLEGFAEAVAGLSKGYFGKMSDSVGRRLPFVRIGYTLSAISKPMMAFFINAPWIFSARTVDRLGKGIRTGARDALLSDEATPATKGRVFGFHRGMDTLGAVLGPSLALLYLYFHPGEYRALFLIAFLPGLLAICLTFIIKEHRAAAKPGKRAGFRDFFHYWSAGPPSYRKLVFGLLLFALINSSDVFLLLRIKSSGASDTGTIGVYIFYNLAYALLSYPLGSLADRLGFKRVFILGLVLFSCVYIGMSFDVGIPGFLALFLLYGLYAAATEGVAKAWISNIVDKHDTATAIGTYTGFQSIGALIASSLTGALWYSFGAKTMLLITGIAAMLVAIYFLFSVSYTHAHKS